MRNVIGFCTLNGTPHMRNRNVFKGKKHDIHQVSIHIGNVALGASTNEVYIAETIVGKELQKLLSEG